MGHVEKKMMVVLSPTILVTALKMNSLNISIKR